MLTTILLAGLINATVDIIIMLLVAFILGYLIRFFIKAPMIKALQHDLKSSQEENEKLKLNIEELNSKIESHEAKIEGLEGDLKRVRHLKQLLQEEKDLVDNNFATLQSDHELLLGKNAEVEKEIAALRSGRQDSSERAAPQPEPIPAAEQRSERMSEHEGHGTSNTTVSPDKQSESGSRDDLTRIKGIGPKIEELLNGQNIHRYSDIANASSSDLSRMLEKAGSSYSIHDPSSWPEQAAFARDGDWGGLKRLQKGLE